MSKNIYFRLRFQQNASQEHTEYNKKKSAIKSELTVFQLN